MPRRTRIAALTMASLLLTGALAACGGGTDDPPPDPGAASPVAATTAPATADQKAGGGPALPPLPAVLTGQKLDWYRCPAPEKARGSDAKPPGSGWRCATMRAPLDYTAPAGETIGIALIRSEAEGPARRIGSLLFNFGGPGGSGVATLPGAADLFDALHERYDLVGFDPRGVAESAGVVCRDSKQTEQSLRIDSTPDTPAEEKIFLDDSRAFGAGCVKRSGRVLPYVGTTSAARDLDLMRQVLGDRELHYFGFSYGTELGGVYAHLFPSKVGRLVLDAVVDPTAGYTAHSRNQALGFQRALDNYFKSRGIGARSGTARVVKLLDRLDQEPLPTSTGRTLTQGLALTGIIAPLYGEDTWPLLTDALEAAENGDGSALLRLADSYNDRDGQGRYSTAHHAQRAISCADAKGRVGADEVRSRLLADFREVSPVFGPYLAWDLAGWCADWPVPGEYETPEVAAPGAAPVLVIGGKGDPATPYEGAERMVGELGEGVGVLLTFEGEGHGAYTTGNRCVTRMVDDYFLRGTVPESGKSCS
ncbi:alpha/beta hydrolase [Streptomyces odonnellii]|uniref:alpha/beta hydrolase n=1 Tax=Streptomyces odonnellii TaxID=1417980 RepID=UPI000625DBA8|nr:alpha/beta hydrolase [Streptomyces odonnellii]